MADWNPRNVLAVPTKHQLSCPSARWKGWNDQIQNLPRPLHKTYELPGTHRPPWYRPPLERGVPLPSWWKEEKREEACSPPKEHQESGVRECSYLQSGIHPLVGGLSAPCKIFPLKKKKRFQRLPKIPETYSSIWEAGMSLGNLVPRSLVIRWPPARDRHWRVQTAPGVEPARGPGG